MNDCFNPNLEAIAVIDDESIPPELNDAIGTSEIICALTDDAKVSLCLQHLRDWS